MQKPGKAMWTHVTDGDFVVGNITECSYYLGV